jgi:hypothetical protein
MSYPDKPPEALTHLDEPFLPHITDPTVYSRLWASGKRFAVCAWNAEVSPYFQAVGDPLISK